MPVSFQGAFFVLKFWLFLILFHQTNPVFWAVEWGKWIAVELYPTIRLFTFNQFCLRLSRNQFDFRDQKTYDIYIHQEAASSCFLFYLVYTICMRLDGGG